MLANVSASAKAFLLVSVSVASMRYDILPLLVLFLASLLLHLAFGISIRSIARPGLYIFFLASFSALVRGLFPGEGRIFAWETLAWSLAYGIRLFTAFLYARLYYSSTKATELGDSLTRLQRAIAGRLRKMRRKPEAGGDSESGILSDPGTLVSLSLLFLPRTFDTLIRIREATMMRSCGTRHRSLKQLFAMVETLVFMSLKTAIATAGALEMRSYSSRRTIGKKPYSIPDWLCILAGIVLVCVSRHCTNL